MIILGSFTYCCRPSTARFEYDSMIKGATFFLDSKFHVTMSCIGGRDGTVLQWKGIEMEKKCSWGGKKQLGGEKSWYKDWKNSQECVFFGIHILKLERYRED